MLDLLTGFFLCACSGGIGAAIGYYICFEEYRANAAERDAIRNAITRMERGNGR